MKKNRAFQSLLFLAASFPLVAAPADPLAAQAKAVGLGVNLPLVGRLIGAGPTLYTSTVDVSVNATASASNSLQTN